MKIITFACTLLTAIAASAAPNDAIPFYVQPQSPFSSGSASLESLLLAQIEQKPILWHKVQSVGVPASRQNTFWMPPGSLITSLETSQKAISKDKTPLYASNNLGEIPITTLDKGQVLEIIDTDGYFAKVTLNEKLKNLWTPLDQLESVPEDLGCLYNMGATQLYTKASDQSEVVAHLAPRSRMKLIKIETSSFALVDYKGTRAYLELAQVVSRLDFAYEVKARNVWKKIKWRKGPAITLEDKSEIHLSDAQEFRTRPDLAIVAKSEDLPIYSRVQVIESSAELWIQSEVKEHGPVWWKKPKDEAAQQSDLGNEEILKRNIVSTAFSPNHKNKSGLISANGVFYSEDGKTWKLLPDFRNKDYPVAISGKGILYVGPYVSYDHGKSFTEYIKWEELTKTLIADLKRPPHRIKLLNIALKDSHEDQISIQVDSGYKKLWLKNFGSNLSWQITTK